MKETIYKSLIAVFSITNLWTIIAFFIFFYEEPGWFHGFETLIFFVWSCWITSAFGIIVILTSYLTYSTLSKKLKLFSLVLTAVLNSFYTLILLILAIQNLIRGEAIIEMFLIANLIISIITILRIKKILMS